jgi:hypothetical protein
MAGTRITHRPVTESRLPLRHREGDGITAEVNAIARQQSGSGCTFFPLLAPRASPPPVTAGTRVLPRWPVRAARQ